MSSNQPNNPLTRRTPPQLALIHTAESVGATVLLGIIGSISQFIGSHGLNLVTLLPFLGGTLLGSLSMIYKTFASNPNLAPAFADTVSQFKAEIQLLLAAHFQGITQLVGQITGNASVVPPPVSNSTQATPWTNTVTSQGASPVQLVPQLQFPPLPQYTAPQAAISSSQAAQPGQPQ